MPDTTDPLLALLQSLATQIGGYFTLVGLVFLVVWVWGARALARRRVQKVKRFTWRQLRSEVLHTLVTFVVGIGSAGAVVALHAMGKTRLVDSMPPGGWPVAAAWVLGIVVFNDAWFYGWHRLLHTPYLYRHVHVVHHRSVDVNPFSSYSFHAFEGFLLGVWIVPAALWLPLPMPALAVVQVIGLLNNVCSHLGYELLPAWWVRLPPFKWTASSTYHNLHHQKLGGNYALFFRFWDKVFGTELPGYEEAFVDRSEPREVPTPSTTR